MVKNILKKVKTVLLSRPMKLYREEIKLVNDPFYFQGSNGQAVLFIHGWTGVPYELRRLGKFLNKKGYTVYAPLLKGHGTFPEDLDNVRWEDWMGDIKQALERIRPDHQKIYIAGTSIGANLAMLWAKQKKDVSGLVLMATPYAIRQEKLVIFLTKFLYLFKRYFRKFYLPSFGSANTVTRRTSYQIYSLKNLLEVFKFLDIFRKNIHEINTPCFLIQSKHDCVINKKSLEKIYAAIGSKIKRKKYIEKAYHTFISDIENDHVFEDIANFLDEN